MALRKVKEIIMLNMHKNYIACLISLDIKIAFNSIISSNLIHLTEPFRVPYRLRFLSFTKQKT